MIAPKVLVVEDEPALAAAVSEALADAGFVVDRAGDGEEGLKKMFDRFLKAESAQQPMHRYHFRDTAERSIARSFG